MDRLGITERGDAGLHFEYVPKLDGLKMAVLITKAAYPDNTAFFDVVRKYKDKIIVHATCTGMGGSNAEPGVVDPLEIKKGIKLLMKILNPYQVVLRLDPICPSERGLITAERVLSMMEDTGVLRVRYSFMQMYSHVNERFRQANIKLPYGGAFQPTRAMKENAYKMMESWESVYMFQACAEGKAEHMTGCIDQYDLRALALEDDIELTGSAGQRRSCMCPGNKTELLNHKGRCAHRCIYCYWR